MNDKKWESTPFAFPTRHGTAQGHSIENRMLSKTPANTISTQIRNNPDGSQTLLRTRAGFPVFSTIQPRLTPIEVLSERGFVAHVVRGSVAAMFSPYTLAIANPKYTQHSHRYTVMAFATKYNVAETDTTGWNDVVSFRNGGVLINGKPMSALGISDSPADALPWLIPDSGAAKYGDAVTNATVKRVFAISRVSVKSWAGNGMEAALGGAERRSDEKALVAAARIDAGSNTAYLSQVSFSGPSWDSIGSSWAFNASKVTMLLTPPYLEKVDSLTGVEQSVCALVATPGSEGSTVNSTVFPDTEIALIGAGETHVKSDLRIDVLWPWAAKYFSSMAGQTYISYSQVLYENQLENTLDLAGRVVVISASNRKLFRTNTEKKAVIEQTIDLPPDGDSQHPGWLQATSDSAEGTFYWPNPDAPDGPRGSDNYYTYGGGIPGTGVYDTESQVGSFSINVDGAVAVAITFTREKEVGTHVRPKGTTTRLDMYLSNPYGQISSGGGLGFWSEYAVISDYSANVLASNQDRLEEKVAMLAAKADQLAAVPLYDANALPYYGGGYYTSKIESVHIDEQTLDWRTRDFLLYDKPNNVFISIEATFSGKQAYGGIGVAELTVILKIDTPSGVATQLLFSREVTYGEMLEEQRLPGGKYAVPSPQLRPMFTPLYQEQGDFRGAAYTTAVEVSMGAAPAYLFNFVLNLATYSAIGGEILDNPVVTFIPCNLVEMLYAYVFSTKAGVGDERYPVEYTMRYNSIMSTLFSSQWRVVFRNGAFVDWLDTLGGIYIEPETTELYRI